MRIRCKLSGAFGRLLAGRLDELRRTLDDLGVRLRGVVSDAVGRSVGTVVRATLVRVLDRLSGSGAEKDEDDEPLPPPRPRGWDEPTGYDSRDLDPADVDLWPDDDWEEPRSPPAPDRPHSEDRLAVSVATGLSAAAWCLRRWAGRAGLAAAATTGLCAGCVAFLAPALAAAAVSLIESLGHARALGAAVGALAVT